MRFRVLGPLEVADGERMVDLGRPKQQTVLAVLLVNANRVVSLDRFVEVLWPHAAADRGIGSLPVYISNLRRLLEPERAPRCQPRLLLTRAPGYVLCVGPEDYDAAAFEALATEGREHLAHGRPRAARQVLGEALGLWRGRALEEFSLEPFAELEAARLEELRMAATQDRVVADLALGAHGTLVGELEGLVREHPLREQLWGLLMLALYRSGRQAEALRAYGRARELMATELGLEPGPELRDLEAAVLAQSPALDWRPPEPEGQEVVRLAAPRARPPRPGDGMVGREPELAAIEDAFGEVRAGSGAVVLVSGSPASERRGWPRRRWHGLRPTRRPWPGAGRQRARGLRRSGPGSRSSAGCCPPATWMPSWTH